MNYIDIEGSGFVVGVPGTYANVRVYYSDEPRVLHVGPLYQEWSEEVSETPSASWHESVAPEEGERDEEHSWVSVTREATSNQDDEERPTPLASL